MYMIEPNLPNIIQKAKTTIICSEHAIELPTASLADY